MDTYDGGDSSDATLDSHALDTGYNFTLGNASYGAGSR